MQCNVIMDKTRFTKSAIGRTIASRDHTTTVARRSVNNLNMLRERNFDISIVVASALVAEFGRRAGFRLRCP